MQIRGTLLRHGTAVTIAITLIGVVSVDVAVASGSSKTIKACASKSTGALRVSAHCTHSEKGVTWSVAGPRGPRGPQGIRGKPGVDASAAQSPQQIDLSTTDITNGASHEFEPFYAESQGANNLLVDGSCGKEGISTPTAFASVLVERPQESNVNFDVSGETATTINSGGAAGASVTGTLSPLTAGSQPYSASGGAFDVQVSSTTGSTSSVSVALLVQEGNTLQSLTAHIEASLTSCSVQVIDVPGPTSMP